MGIVCGIDVNKAGSDKIAKKDCSQADEFNEILESMRAERKDAAFESSQQANYQSGQQNHTCAAANREVSAVDTLNVKRYSGLDRCGDAQRLYESAGRDRLRAAALAGAIGEEKMDAAEAANKAKNYGKAAKQYGEAAKHYGEAARNERKAYDDFKLAGDKELADNARTEWIKDNRAAKAAAALEEQAEAHIKRKK